MVVNRCVGVQAGYYNRRVDTSIFTGKEGVMSHSSCKCASEECNLTQIPA